MPGSRQVLAFDTNVPLDLADAKQRAADRHLQDDLDVVGLSRPDTASLRMGGAGAKEIVEALWSKPPTYPSHWNDLGCALAWLHRWDEATAALHASLNLKLTPGEEARAKHNLKVVASAAELLDA